MTLTLATMKRTSVFLTFFSVGTYTALAILMWALLLLANHPDIQGEIYLASSIRNQTSHIQKHQSLCHQRRSE
ncbi:CYP2B4: Cytochrome protein [Crotalus adamanteus]|uniref:CYP2B4: Cytochrome protein n=1 Tax=Crotalus adamanteus TaxID=8729 RepID=A0AAW1BHV9_CROAD